MRAPSMIGAAAGFSSRSANTRLEDARVGCSPAPSRDTEIREGKDVAKPVTAAKAGATGRFPWAAREAAASVNRISMIRLAASAVRIFE